MAKGLRIYVKVSAAMLLAATPAAAQSLWDHNGSLMRVVESGSNLGVYYDRVRPGLVETIPPGSPQFEGQRIGDALAGYAFVYTKYCPGMRFPYHVQGNIWNGIIDLRGPAAVVDPNICAIVGYRPDSGNAHIVTTIVTPGYPLTPPPVAVAPSSSCTGICAPIQVAPAPAPAPVLTPPPRVLDPDAQAADIERQGREFCRQHPEHKVCKQAPAPVPAEPYIDK